MKPSGEIGPTIGRADAVDVRGRGRVPGSCGLKTDCRGASPPAGSLGPLRISPPLKGTVHPPTSTAITAGGYSVQAGVEWGRTRLSGLSGAPRDQKRRGEPTWTNGPMFRLKRAYEASSKEDGLRVLVERLWPRGLSKQRAAIDWWLKDVAPSPELRKRFGHDPSKWPEFQKEYRAELRGNKRAFEELRSKGEAGTVTLVYAARDVEHNSALALKRFLERGRR